MILRTSAILTLIKTCYRLHGIFRLFKSLSTGSLIFNLYPKLNLSNKRSINLYYNTITILYKPLFVLWFYYFKNPIAILLFDQKLIKFHHKSLTMVKST